MPNPPIDNQRPSVRYSLICSFYLCLTILFVWLWTSNPILNNYNLQLTGAIIIIYFLCRTFLPKKPTRHPDQLALDVTVMTFVILLVTSTTGGLNSSLFFLIYFLLFAVALIFDTTTTLILTIGIALFFGSSLTSSRAAIQLSSLLFFSPMAIYFGKLYTNLLNTKLQFKQLKKVEHNLSKDITGEESLILPWLTLNFKETMIKVVHLTSEMLSDIGSLKSAQREKLNKILSDSKELLASGEELKEDIDKTTD